jgi:twitching motility protein PilT
MDITQLLAFGVQEGASDCHLSAGEPPMLRVNGDLKKLDYAALTKEEVHALVYDIMGDAQRKAFEETHECDFSFEMGTVARFRVNVFMQRKGTGPTGSGKSTTLAAMIDYLNTTFEGHILTVEDPIEFVHQSKKCLVNQRELGPHTNSFANALRAALREDPDAILVGEMRDLETIQLALTAAETGHIVFGTLHTSSAPKTVDRIIDVFPPNQQAQIRAQFAESVEAVITQTLLKKKGGGRLAALEIMTGTTAIRNLIREGKIHQVPGTMQVSQRDGMQTMDMALQALVARGLVSKEEAQSKSMNPNLFGGGFGVGGVAAGAQGR